MSVEKRLIKLMKPDNSIVNAELFLYEEAEDMVLIEIEIDGNKSSFQHDNFFLSLFDLRKKLESENIQILCNGAAENVYPSQMQLSMGTGRKAYFQDIGKRRGEMSKDIPEHLESTYKMIMSAFPNGIAEDSYDALIALLYDEMSDRNLAETLSYLNGEHYLMILQDVYRVAVDRGAIENLEEVRALLLKHGYEEWLNE